MKSMLKKVLILALCLCAVFALFSCESNDKVDEHAAEENENEKDPSDPDSESSTGNVIETGTLDVKMFWAEGTVAVPDADSADWKNGSEGAIFDYDNWEPGYAQVRHVKIANEGSLALKYTVKIVANGTVSDLSDVIDVYYFDPAAQITDRAALTSDKRIGSLTDVLTNLATTGNGTLEAGKSDTITIAFKMNENAGYEYMNKPLGADFAVQIIATQLTDENDSFGDQYDAEAWTPFVGGTGTETDP